MVKSACVFSMHPPFLSVLRCDVYVIPFLFLSLVRPLLFTAIICTGVLPGHQAWGLDAFVFRALLFSPYSTLDSYHCSMLSLCTRLLGLRLCIYATFLCAYTSSPVINSFSPPA